MALSRQRLALLLIMALVLVAFAFAVFAFSHPGLVQHLMVDGPNIKNRYG